MWFSLAADRSGSASIPTNGLKEKRCRMPPDVLCAFGCGFDFWQRRACAFYCGQYIRSCVNDFSLTIDKYLFALFVAQGGFYGVFLQLINWYLMVPLS